MIAGETPAKRRTTPPQAALPAPEEKPGQAQELIAKHPLVTVGGALAVGALIGLVRSGKRSGGKGLLRGMIGGIAMALVREAVLDRVSSYANSWIDQKSREETASRQRGAEAFLE